MLHRIASTNQHPILFLFFGARIYQEAHARCDTAHGAWQWKTRGGETLETGWHLVVAALCVKSMLEILFVIKRWTLDQVHMISGTYGKFNLGEALVGAAWIKNAVFSPDQVAVQCCRSR